jgi:hypothetical protein
MATGDAVESAVEPVLTTVGQGILHPGPLGELLYGTLALIIVISLHGWCMTSISRQFARRFAALDRNASNWRLSFLTSTTIALLVATHLFETFLWAAPIWGLQLIPSLRDAYFFVMETYTTLGNSSVDLPHEWRLIGPMIAISGLFTFSWTGSVLVYVVSDTNRRMRHLPPEPPGSDP